MDARDPAEAVEILDLLLTYSARASVGSKGG
jgi:hypothetical protein